LLHGQLVEFGLQLVRVGSDRALVKLAPPLGQAAQARLELLRPRLLDADDLLGLVRGERPRVPLFLPVGERLLRLLEGSLGTALRFLRALEARDELVQRQLELFDLAPVLADVRGNLARALYGLLEVLALPLAQLLGMLDRLLEPRDLRARTVEPCLHGVERVATLGLRNARPFHVGF